MAERLTIDEMINQIRIDLSSVKTDVKWLKRITTGSIGTVIVLAVGSNAGAFL